MDYSTHLDKPLEVYNGKGRLWVLGFACLGFVAVGAWFFLEYLNGTMIFLYGLVGLVCIVFFGACMLYFVRKMFDRTPAIIINDEGVFDNSSYIPGGLVRWEDITHIELYELAGQQMIGIQLKDPDTFLKGQQGLKRRLIQINQGMVKAPVNIAQSALTLPLAQIYEEMLIRWQSHQEPR
ncbi:hypothetical protein C2I18_27435 [Paenibacillus sp. PK3_47]|uniref:STM3941 family protein n=1 Tax=Paenibacillus sp. PK3_47 TaxID=2072642 RepID=UPI00201DE958|nr:STM3941 family protein [Paenibacillus sp. PK3_47]UQZ36937.1 hypothetical protein C2I18_27435 [Paenibacillus sp. PK3_47]